MHLFSSVTKFTKVVFLFAYNRSAYTIVNASSLSLPAEAGSYEHASKQRRHRHVQRHVVCTGAHGPQDQNRRYTLHGPARRKQQHCSVAAFTQRYLQL